MTHLRSDYRFGIDVRVRWQECDAQGIAFNGSYLGWLEIAQAEYFRNLGFSIYRVAAAGYFDSAVAKVTIEYKAPVRVDEMLDLRARVARIGNTSLALEVAIFAEDGGPDDTRSPPSRPFTSGSTRTPARPGACPTRYGNWWTVGKLPARCCRWKGSRNWQRLSGSSGVSFSLAARKLRLAFLVVRAVDGGDGLQLVRVCQAGGGHDSSDDASPLRCTAQFLALLPALIAPLPATTQGEIYHRHDYSYREWHCANGSLGDYAAYEGQHQHSQVRYTRQRFYNRLPFPDSQRSLVEG